jgi:hypothetical protein
MKRRTGARIGDGGVGPPVENRCCPLPADLAWTSVLSRTFAIRGGYRVDPNQELIALGAANTATGLFQGFPISSSSSRTPVAVQAGAKTQLTGLLGAGAIALMLVLVPNIVQDLPSAALALRGRGRGVAGLGQAVGPLLLSIFWRVEVSPHGGEAGGPSVLRLRFVAEVL